MHALQVFFVAPSSNRPSHCITQLVLFSDSVHLSASSDAERGEWIFLLQKLIPRSSYDEGDPLQAAAMRKDVEVVEAEFFSSSSPGVLLERRGNFAVAGLVSESLSRRVCQGSVLSKIEGKPAIMMGFEAVVTALSYWNPPLRLSFSLMPKKMGWLTLMVRENRRGCWPENQKKEATWGTFDLSACKLVIRYLTCLVCSPQTVVKVYATLSSGVVTLFAVKRDGKSKVRSFALYGSAVGLVDSNSVDGNKHCFRVLDGIGTVVLQASSHECMMEWGASIAHSISFQNGGGILLDKEKIALAAEDGFWVDSAGFPRRVENLFRAADNENVAKSIVFAKPVKDFSFGPMKCDEADWLKLPAKKIAPHKPMTPRKTDTPEEVIPDKTDSNELNDATEEHVTKAIGVMKPKSTVTEATDEVNTTFNSSEPVDISIISNTMEDFARNFFFMKDTPTSLGTNIDLPVQELRTPWLVIDQMASASSGSEIFDEASDHIGSVDFGSYFTFRQQQVGPMQTKH